MYMHNRSTCKWRVLTPCGCAGSDGKGACVIERGIHVYTIEVHVNVYTRYMKTEYLHPVVVQVGMDKVSWRMWRQIYMYMYM